ncbi:alpha/beta hydrolase fold domain-containing protein [Streptomyces sp. NPDC016845]|uniref:alpha/beta hydrolase fold domain-containing protein n=1 Tax=Streptomyces sp. NPDC016845 TaxID=3364972 RepID=UPI0037BBECDA
MTAAEVRALIAAPHPDVAPLPPAAERGAGTRVLRGVPYGVVEGGRPLELDLWLPAAQARRPVPLVLFLHGGAWRRGRRDDMGVRTRAWEPGPFERIAAAGLAVACVDYRLSGEALFPAQLDDVRAALRWLGLRADELGIDSERVVVWGESAGGHLASLLALTHPEPPLAGAVVWYGPSDLETPRPPFDPADPSSMEALLLGAAPSTVPERAAAASPVRRAHAGAPPFLIVHGEADTMVPCGHGRDLAAALRAAGAEAELRIVAGAEHGWVGADEDEVAEIFRASLEFTRRTA